MKIIVLFIIYLGKIVDRLYMYLCRSAFASIGRNVIFHPTNSTFTFNSVSIGDNVGIGTRACFIASISHIYIGNNVAIAPNVTIRGGNHRFDIVGKWMTAYGDTDKDKTDDSPVYVEDDCWIGTNVTILKGVTIGRGSVVAAGAVVNKSCPPYSVIGGVPAKIIRFRWDNIQKILEHENILYTENERISRKILEESFEEYGRTRRS